MPDYSKLEELMSHRVRIDYDTGAHIIGYLAACRPAGGGQVQFVTISKAEVVLADGTVVENHDALTVPANVMTGFRKDEGPRGRD